MSSKCPQVHEFFTTPTYEFIRLAIIQIGGRSSYLRRSQYPSLELEALLLRVEHRVILLARHRRHEGRLMLVRVELVALDTGVKPLQTMFLQRRHQDRFRHLQALV